MSSEHFTLTISQSTSDSGDFAIHFNEQGKRREKMLVQLQFVDQKLFDDTFMDEIVAVVARKLARKIIEQKGNPELAKKSRATHEKHARKVVKDMLDKMRKMP
ncbi:hypothetical protein M3P05_11455 [Sansalvadorimonas sp. 2012CJ34-2]|uniref:Uncharacterized protein n=1 Tax=Parendozoicomonas callyspongiae TaxID=2942213 RepID=A0ABT0PGQ6_9GAMM|nr:hypothetical protein [Sansalvadorimonas sp. 2012CJ34-2]MCL6270539.1 hypothetical protein [Sansalvadorimonas sp. 2012CJ34-2]